MALGLSSGSPETDPISDPMTDIENVVPIGHDARVLPTEARAPPAVPRLNLTNMDPGMDVSLLAPNVAREEPLLNVTYDLVFPAGNGLPYPVGSDPARGMWVPPEPSVPSMVYVESRGRYQPVRGARWVTLNNDDAPPLSARGEHPRHA